MGKKNRRNRAKKNTIAAGATTSAQDSLAAVLHGIFSESEAVVSSATAVGDSGDDARSCYHGSSKEAFRNEQYRKAGREYVESLLAQESEEEFVRCHEAFRRKYALTLIIDEEFSKYLFAVCAQDHLLHGFIEVDGVRSRVMRYLLHLAILVRYLYVPRGDGKVVPYGIEHEKFTKYERDIWTVRGVVDVLARETHDCDCFKDAKKAARTMKKVGRCYGCLDEFPKEKLLKCQCGVPQYCSRECQLDDWHKHKYQCIAKPKSKWKSKTNTMDGSNGDGG